VALLGCFGALKAVFATALGEQNAGKGQKTENSNSYEQYLAKNSSCHDFTPYSIWRLSIFSKLVTTGYNVTNSKFKPNYIIEALA